MLYDINEEAIFNIFCDTIDAIEWLEEGFNDVKEKHLSDNLNYAKTIMTTCLHTWQDLNCPAFQDEIFEED